MSQPLEITLRTLTPLWTGGVDQTADRLHETGLIGSLRWWYEALVRGLGGYACDPTAEGRCEYDPKKPDPPEKQLCAVCYLFGCTGWARKFRLRVLDSSGQLIRGPIQANAELVLEFVELRPIGPEEKWLLVKAVEIATRYGALGGKTTLKPQRGPMGEDFGIAEWVQGPNVQKPEDVATFLQGFRRDTQPQEYPNLVRFFFVQGAYLLRLQMNALLGLNNQGRPLANSDEVQRFLQGRRGTAQSDAVSKKLFSFKAGGGRIWGYARDVGMRDEIIRRIKRQLGKRPFTVKTGEEVLHEL
ncbi:MAG: type III-B CRISPR module RAMP protein Cmr1 [Candidatus Caldarchaeum sp.]